MAKGAGEKGDVNAGSDRINQGSWKVTKSGSVRQAGQLPTGDGSTGRGSTAREGTLGNSKGDTGSETVTFTPAFAYGTKQKFRPTPGRGPVK